MGPLTVGQAAQHLSRDRTGLDSRNPAKAVCLMVPVLLMKQEVWASEHQCFSCRGQK